MALIDKASLLMVSSTYEAGKLYNVLPSGNKAPDETGNHNGYDQTRADFTFDRGSNAAATRVNASGLIEKYRENLVTHSNNFSDSAWAHGSSTATSGFEGYDGTNNAWKWSSVSTGTAQLTQSHGTSGMITHSIYAKAGTIDVLKIWVGLSAEFNLTTGVTSYSQSKMTDVGNGWWRCEVYLAYTIFNPFFTATTAGDYIYIQNAQVEKSLVATDYLDSTSVTAKAGVLVDLPRINYDANGENGALLLEPSRVNSLPHSEYFGDSSWSKSGMTLTTNTSDTKSPEGVYNAAHVEATNTDPYLLAFPSVTTGDVTFSIYVKAIGDAVGRACSIHLDYNFGTATGTNATQGFNAPSDWTRFDVTGNCSASGTVRVRAELGNAATIGDDFYIYGAQVESSASYPSSYIPTMGTSETRAADSCSVTGLQTNNLLGSNQGSFVFHYKPYNVYTGNAGEIFDFRIDANNRVATYFSSGTLRLFSNIAGSTNFNQATTLDGDTEFKIALAFDTNSTLVYINGSLEYTLNGFALGLTDFDIVPPTNGSKLSECSWYPTKLSGSELATLTTL